MSPPRRAARTNTVASRSSDTLEKARSIAVQLVGVGGLASLVEGVREFSPSAALIVGGVLAVAWAILKHTSTAEANPK
jgi:uncharacterized protein (DUF697 family)